MPEPAELRRLPRYQIQLPLLYKIASAESKFGVGWTRNLSEGGALVELDDHVQPDTPLHLSLRTDTGSIEIEARVTWAEAPRQDGGDVLHNLEFTQIDPGHLQALCDLLLPLSMVPHAGVRLPLDIPVSCRHKGRQGPVIKGRTGDVDRRGLLLRLPLGIPPGTPLALTLHTTKGTVMTVCLSHPLHANSMDDARESRAADGGLARIIHEFALHVGTAPSPCPSPVTRCIGKSNGSPGEGIRNWAPLPRWERARVRVSQGFGE